MTVSKPALSVIFLVLIGAFFIRLWPVIAGQPALSEVFLTEDGYLMLTVARNMALGLGMSVSDGTIATNGVQPLATFLYTIPYLLTDGDRIAGLAGVHLIMIAIGVGGIFAIRALARRLLAPLGSEHTELLAWLVAALWFVGPNLARHSMNGLETGLITLCLALTLVQFFRVLDEGADARLGARLWLGALCGISFLARIDAALFCIVLFTIWALDMLIRQRQGFATTFVWLLPPGLLSLVIAAPWLLNNLLGFGSLMPISGPAQSLSAEFGGNLALLPSKLFEYLFPMLPLPGFVEALPGAPLVMLVILLAVFGVYFIQSLMRGSGAARATLLVLTGYMLVLCTYYGAFFGAPHFVSRYLAPIAPVLIIAAIWTSYVLGRVIFAARPAVLTMVYGFGGLALSLALLGRLLLPGGPEQGHTQVVAWVAENISEDTWVGAVQTGTLGYWHDRTINLDGKVNPDALAARIEDGHVLHYIIDSEIDYVVDWASVGDWVNLPVAEYAAAFELALQDEGANISVQRRRATTEPLE